MADTPTQRYVRTRFGIHCFEDIESRLWRIYDNESEDLDHEVVWEFVKVVFGKTGSLPPVK